MLCRRRRPCRYPRRGPGPPGASPWRCQGGRCRTRSSSSSTALTIRRSPRGLSFIQDLHRDGAPARLALTGVPMAGILRRSRLNQGQIGTLVTRVPTGLRRQFWAPPCRAAGPGGPAGFHDAREAHDRDGVLEADVAAVDRSPRKWTISSVRRELGVVVCRCRAESSLIRLTSTLSMTVWKELLARRVLGIHGDEHRPGS